jgi:Protein tyrosine and serine/threonine kinase/Leucine rich repeat
MTLEALRRGDLAGARVLHLNAGLTEFPTEIFGLADTLEVLDLGGNALTALPADMARLKHLQVIFCSGSRFERLPPSLGDCPALSQIGFRKTGLREIPGEALPRALRWLTVTDNALTTLPAALGERPGLQKLMLAGNRLDALPEALAAAEQLELLRLSANRFAILPPWLIRLPRLAWLGYSGNLFDTPPGAAPSSVIDWRHLQPEAVLGEGASGLVHRALWQPPGEAAPQTVALKLFKGRMTSDGMPEREMAACLAAGAHPRLTYAMGRLTGHPEGFDGLVMPLLPPDWRPLAGPPSLESCTRDVYEPELRLATEVALRLATGTATATAHLHARGLLHGDLYAHNTIWDGTTGESVLSDFGAAASLPAGEDGLALQRIEVLAWGILFGELLDRSPKTDPGLRALHRHCVNPDPAARPLMADVVAALAA